MGKKSRLIALQIRRGLVVLVNLGTVHSVEGHEQALTRSCLIIKPMNVLELATVLPFSTSRPPRAAGRPVKIAKGTANLIADSYVLIHQIRTLSTRRIAHEIGQLPAEQFEKIKQETARFLEL